MKKILIVEDDTAFAVMLKTWLAKKGYDIKSAANVTDAESVMKSERFDIILTDMRLPDYDGTELLDWINKTGYDTDTIVMTGYADISNAVTCMKMGAKDYITKPIEPEALLSKIESCNGGERGPKAYARTKPHSPQDSGEDNGFVIGSSPAAKKMHEHIRLVAPTNISVLIHGESGTGKEHLAKLIHKMSSRKDKPYIAVDCGAIPKDLAGSEFFGHKKGSFTGALSDKKGAFAEANGGTLFLDEVGNLSYEVQVQLLRAIQERKIRPIGTNTEIEVDIRLIAATNENLKDAIKDGSFREDLYHRLNGFCLEVPALRDQKEDLGAYVDFFIKEANEDLGKNLKGVSQQVEDIFIRYNWPGNIRELKNIIMRSAILATGDFITVNELPESMKDPDKTEDLSLHKKEEEKQSIIKALEIAGNNKSKAAQLLNIDRKTLYNKIKQYGIND